MADNFFKKLTDEEKDHLWMYMIFNKDAIIEKMDEWNKEAEKRDMTLTEYLESINPLNDRQERGMTKEEAKEFIVRSVKDDVDIARVADAIKALEQEPFKPMVEIDLYSVIQQKYIERDVLDKIRGEIKTMGGDIETIADVLTIIDKYRAQSEE